MRLLGNEFSQLFVTLQMCMGYTTDKELFLNNIARTIGIFDFPPKFDLLFFIFIHLVSTLITDRLYINNRQREITQQKIISKLLFKQKPFQSLEKIIRRLTIQENNELKEMLSEITTSSPSTNGILFKLKSHELWNPISPLDFSNKTLSKYTKYIAKFPNNLMPFKPFEEEPFGLDLHSYLFTPTLLAIEYYILMQNNSQETNQLVLNLLLIASKLRDKTKKIEIDEKPIIVSNLEQLTEDMPTEFESAIKQKFIFISNSPQSIVDLVASLGKLGLNVLKEMDISYVDKEDKTQNETKTRSSRASDLRASIMRNFNNKIQQFEKGNVTINESNIKENSCEVCSVCNVQIEDEILCYPMFIYLSSVPVRYDYTFVDRVICFNICKHLLHHTCRGGICPIDRILKNCYLPKLDDINDLTQPKVLNIVSAFGKTLAADEEMGHIVLGLSSLLVIYEVRSRANPSALDPDKYFLLARNLFLNLRVLYQMGTKMSSQISQFQYFISDLITSKVPEKEIKEIARKYTRTLKGEKLQLFLRRVRITEYFVLGIGHAQYIDWDELLSNEQLCLYYNVIWDKNEYDMIPFTLTKLPKNYLRFGAEPFNLDEQISTSEVRYFLSLLDGKVLEERKIFEYMNNSKDDFILLMNLNSKHSQINILMEKFFPSLFKVPSVYLDFLGNEGIGFVNGFELFLSEEKYEKLADDFLSGEIIKYVELVD